MLGKKWSLACETPDIKSELCSRLELSFKFLVCYRAGEGAWAGACRAGKGAWPGARRTSEGACPGARRAGEGNFAVQLPEEDKQSIVETLQIKFLPNTGCHTDLSAYLYFILIRTPVP